jgi:hypothetical protein
MIYPYYQTTAYGGSFVSSLVHLMPRAHESGSTFEKLKSGNIKQELK